MTKTNQFAILCALFYPLMIFGQSSDNDFRVFFGTCADSIVAESYLQTHNPSMGDALFGTWTEVLTEYHLPNIDPFVVTFSSDSIFTPTKPNGIRYIMQGDSLRFIEECEAGLKLQPSPYCDIDIPVLYVVDGNWLLWCYTQRVPIKYQRKAIRDPDVCPNCDLLKRN